MISVSHIEISLHKVWFREVSLERIAYQLRIKQEKIEEYDSEHQRVWPELLEELENFGVSQYSIFRRDQTLVLYLHVPDFQEFKKKAARSQINLRWQEKMAPLFERVPDLRPDESEAMMKEVFFLRGSGGCACASETERR
jgi:L-rhamnose mutarotase